MKLRNFTAFLVVMTFGVMAAWGAYTQNPYTSAGESAGKWVQSWYLQDGNVVRIIESTLTHPSHTDGFVDAGDDVLVGDEGMVGVALESATAATDYINVALSGIIYLSVTNAAAMSIGDEVFINTTTAALTDAATSSIKFGHVLVAISTTGSAVVVPVMITPIVATTSSFTSVSASANLYVGANADIDGTLGTTGTITSGSDVIISDDLFVGDDAIVPGDLQTTTILVGTGGTKIDKLLCTSGTISSGATSATLSIAYDATQDFISVTIQPAFQNASYVGFADWYIKDNETGVIDVNVTSGTTKGDLTVYAIVLSNDD